MLGHLLVIVAAVWLVGALLSRRSGCSLHAFHEGRHHGRRFHPGQLLYAARSLHLDTLQKEQVKDILRAMRRLGDEVRIDQHDRMEALADAMGAGKFDRAQLDALIAGQLDKESMARKEVIDRIELFHAGLTTEQREALQRMLGSEEKGEQKAPPPPPPPPPAPPASGEGSSTH